MKYKRSGESIRNRCIDIVKDSNIPISIPLIILRLKDLYGIDLYKTKYPRHTVKKLLKDSSCIKNSDNKYIHMSKIDSLYE